MPPLHGMNWGEDVVLLPETSQKLVSQISWEDSQETISDTFVGLGMEILHGGKHERKKLLTQRM